MANHLLDRDTVLSLSKELPVFPKVVHEILSTIDDPESNLKVLAGYIQHDPVVSARVICMANAAASQRGGDGCINNVFAATSMIGMARVRELALMSALNRFVKAINVESDHSFWEHSVIVGVCSEELANTCDLKVSSAEALIAGLLHDVGQLWLMRFQRQQSGAAWMAALQNNIDIERAECHRFGVGHPLIGAWLAESWQLPMSIINAIRGHHAPEGEVPDRLAAVVHIAEVLSNGLDLTSREENRVTYISEAACTCLGIRWDSNIRLLFGRMEGRARHATRFFYDQNG